MHDLDPNDPRPPYIQLAAALRDAIQAGEFQAGDKLPSRIELAQRYGLAGATIAHAVDVLANEGLVVPRQGSGVFVHTSGAPVLTNAEIRAELVALRHRINLLENALDQREQHHTTAPASCTAEQH